MAWTSILADTFNRANTTVDATPGSTAGVGNGWADIEGGVWAINANTATPTAGDLEKWLARTADTTIKRCKITLLSTWDNEPVSVWLRINTNKSGFYGIYASLTPNGGFTTVVLGVGSASIRYGRQLASFIRVTGKVYTMDVWLDTANNHVVEIRDASDNSLVSTLTTDSSEANAVPLRIGIGSASRIDSVELFSGDPSDAPTTVDIPYTSSSIFYSPYNWRNNGTRMVSNNPGAYFKFRFTGTYLGLRINNAFNNVSPQNVPFVCWRVDDGVIERKQLSRILPVTDLETSLAEATHEATIWFGAAAQPTNDRWTTPDVALTLQAIVLSIGATISAPSVIHADRAIFYGDSITETIVDTTSDFSIGTWAYFVAEALACEYAQIGFSSQGWTVSGFGNVPSFTNTWNNFSNGQSRASALTASPPKYIFINHGTNDENSNILDSVTIPAITSTLTAMRAAVGSTTIIYLMVPFSGRKKTAITTAFNNYQSATPDSSTILVELPLAAGDGISVGDVAPSAYSEDALHPNLVGSTRAAAFLLKKLGGNERTGTTTLTQSVTRGGVNLAGTNFKITGSIFDVTGTTVYYYDTTGVKSWKKGQSSFLNTLPGTAKDEIPAYGSFQIFPGTAIVVPNSQFSFGSVI